MSSMLIMAILCYCSTSLFHSSLSSLRLNACLLPLEITIRGMDLQSLIKPSLVETIGLSILISCKELNQKTLQPISVTELGMTICCNDPHWEKAQLPMLVTVFGIMICSKELHSQKALPPMFVRDLDRTMSSRDSHWEKAPSSILVTESDMMTWYKDLHP